MITHTLTKTQYDTAKEKTNTHYNTAIINYITDHCHKVVKRYVYILLWPLLRLDLH